MALPGSQFCHAHAPAEPQARPVLADISVDEAQVSTCRNVKFDRDTIVQLKTPEAEKESKPEEVPEPEGQATNQTDNGILEAGFLNKTRKNWI